MNNSIEKVTKKVSSILKKISIKEKNKIKHVANIIAKKYFIGGKTYIFGTGHNHCIAEEALHRAGGFAGVFPILDPKIDFSLGVKKASALERNKKIANKILKKYVLKKNDVIIIFSNSGINKLPIEVAKIAKNNKMVVISVLSKAYTDSLTKSKINKLYYYSDFFINNYSPIGDTLLKNNKFGISSSSTIAGIFILNTIWAELAILLKKEKPFPFYKSSNLPNSKKHNKILEKKYNFINNKLK